MSILIVAIEREELAEKKAQKMNGELRPLTREVLRGMQFAELEILLRILRNAIEERHEMMRNWEASRSTTSRSRERLES